MYLQANKNYLKAYVHMGKAHLSLHQYTEARNSYNKILEIDAKKEKMVQGKYSFPTQ